MSTLLKPIMVRKELLRLEIRTFQPAIFSKIFEVSPLSTKYFLERQTREGLFLRLKKGLYTLKTDLPSEEEIANALYKPSYLSFEYALAYHGLIPEMPYAITSATTKPTREFIVAQKSFLYLTIKNEAYTGYSLIKLENKSFLIADPEKAVADYLYFESLGKKTHNDRLNLDSVNKDQLNRYMNLYNRNLS